MLDRLIGFEEVDPADEILVARDPELRHDPPRFFGNEEEEIDDVLGRALEAAPELGVLCRDADRARVQVAGAHHHAARRDQRRRCEADLVGAEQRCDHDVTTRFQLTVGLNPDPRAEVVADERLLGLGEPDLPGDACKEDRGERRGARAAVVPRDQDVVGVRLGDTRCDGANAHLGDELDRDPRPGIRAAEVVDELLRSSIE